MIGPLSFPRGFTRGTVDRRPTKAAYALPSAFTAGNMFLGFIAVSKCFEGLVAIASGMVGHNPHFDLAARMIVLAGLLDGLDGRIARLTNTTSDFGRELDSLADVITFGIAPAVLAFCWGLYGVDLDHAVRDHLLRFGYFVCFLFLLCGSARLARFNITTNPVPRNPGRPDRKYFVGLPIPAAAGAVASVVIAANAEPIQWWPMAALWIAVVAGLAMLMVSAWRYRSFKDLNLLRPRSPILVVLLGSLIFLIWTWPQIVLVTVSVLYVGSGVLVRFGGIAKRRFGDRPGAA